MANVSAIGTTQNDPNYLGILFEIGQNKTPFLNMIGGVSGARIVPTWNFALNSNYALETASQPSISEDASATSPTATTYVRAQAENSIQIFQRTAQITYADDSDFSTLAGVPSMGGMNPVTDKKAFQVASNLRQVAVDLEYTLINGAYVKKTASNVASTSRGLSEAITTNVIAGGGATLTSAMFNSLTKSMVDNGADLDGNVILVNSTYKQKLSELFVLQERSNSIGGVNVEVIATDFGLLNVVYCPQVPQTEIIIADISACSVAVLPTDGQALVVQDLAQIGASKPVMIYGQMALDYGVENLHGKIENLL
jgi:hypothetical protein